MPFTVHHNLFPNTIYNTYRIPELPIGFFPTFDAAYSPSRTALATFYLQDPSTLNITGEGVGAAEITVTGNRLTNSMVTSVYQVNPNSDGNFIFSPLTKEFNITNAFVIVNLVIKMYQKTLQNINPTHQFLNWQWGAGAPLTVNVYAGMEQNAFYAREEQALKFFYFFDQFGRIVYTAASLDVVAHETGHAILDALMPGYFEPSILGKDGNLYPNPETGALHESFGDLTAMFLLLSLPKVSQTLIEQTNGNLHKRNFLNSLAEQFGQAMGEFALRDADNDLTLEQATNNYTDFEVHQLSNVFTGAIYDILVDFFNLNSVKNAATLTSTAEEVKKLVLNAILAGPAEGASYVDIVEGMLRLESDPQKQSIIKYQFFDKRHLCRLNYQDGGMLQLTRQYNKKPSSRSCSTLPNHACCKGHAIARCLHGNANMLSRSVYGSPMMRFSQVSPYTSTYVMDTRVALQPSCSTQRNVVPYRYYLGF